MNKIDLFAPVNRPDDIIFIKNSSVKGVYVNYAHFIDEGFEAAYDFIDKAQKANFEFYVKFPKNIDESEIPQLEQILEFLEKTDISGIFINSLLLLELLPARPLPFKVIIDSGLNIHNLSGIEFVNLFYKIENINLTEEIYIKNIAKIKKYTKYSLSIDSNNLPWIAEEIKKSQVVDLVVIKGDFKNEKELLNGILLIQQILENPKAFKNKKLPFKSGKDYFYETNHFSGEFLSSEGKDFKFSGNIKKFEPTFKRVQLKKPLKIQNDNFYLLPKINLRLSSFEHVTYLKKYIKTLGFNPIHSIEYGEILNTADLAKNSFNMILEKIKLFCASNNIKLNLSTPRILIERDFDRVYEYVKQLFEENPYPDSLVINNIGFWWAAINDSDYKNVNIELGQGLELDNSASILYLANQHKVSCVDLSNFKNIENITTCVNKIKDKISVKKLTVGGCVRIPCSGLCPLNNDSAILSRLSCTAPCHHGQFTIFDPQSNLKFLMAVDGFCRLHLFKEQILDLFKYVRTLEKVGINEFVIDFSGLNAKLVPIMLNRFLNALQVENYKTDSAFLDDEYEIKNACML